MKRNMCIALAAVATLALASWAWAADGAGEGKERHPHMRKAVHHLNQVKKELEAAKHDYNGHRAAAIADAQKAIDEIVAGLESDGWKGPHHLVPSARATPDEGKSHHEMHRALHHLRQAKWQLEHAAHDYHGHRVEAVKLVNRAIKQVKEGIESVEGK